MTEQKKYNDFTLSQCAKFDAETGARNKLTMWGRVSADRHARGISRKQRILRKKQEAA
jgi:hypothetical protein